MAKLDGQVAVITGAARGIGEAISHRLAELGALVVLVARDAARLNEVESRIHESGGRAEVAALDLRSAEQIEALANRVIKQHGRCDVLVNNAGIANAGSPLHEMALPEWQAVIETNLQAPYLLIRAFAPVMIKARAGHIINISSLAGRNPLPNGAAYSASKWALNGLTYSVAEELRPHNIRVSVVAPGSVNTGFGGGGEASANWKIQPTDVAHVVEMLLTQAQQSFVSEVLMRPTRKP